MSKLCVGKDILLLFERGFFFLFIQNTIYWAVSTSRMWWQIARLFSGHEATSSCTLIHQWYCSGTEVTEWSPQNVISIISPVNNILFPLQPILVYLCELVCPEFPLIHKTIFIFCIWYIVHIFIYVLLRKKCTWSCDYWPEDTLSN